MANRRMARNVAGRRRLIGGLALTAVAVLAALVVVPAASSGNPDNRVITAGAKPTTTTTTTTPGPTTTTTTPPPPYGQPSIEVSALTYTASKTSTTISGSFLITNVSGATPTDVLVIQQRISVEYKTSANGKYTMMAAPTCTFTPAAPYTIPFQQQQTVTFTCTLAAPFPSTAKFVRVGAIVNIQGRDMDFSIREEQAL